MYDHANKTLKRRKEGNKGKTLIRSWRFTYHNTPKSQTNQKRLEEV